MDGQLGQHRQCLPADRIVQRDNPGPAGLGVGQQDLLGRQVERGPLKAEALVQAHPGIAQHPQYVAEHPWHDGQHRLEIRRRDGYESVAALADDRTVEIAGRVLVQPSPRNTGCQNTGQRGQVAADRGIAGFPAPCPNVLVDDAGRDFVNELALQIRVELADRHEVSREHARLDLRRELFRPLDNRTHIAVPLPEKYLIALGLDLFLYGFDFPPRYRDRSRS